MTVIAGLDECNNIGGIVTVPIVRMRNRVTLVE